MFSRGRRWWLERKKQNALRAYVLNLGPALEKAYGRDDTYSVGRIRTALHNEGLPVEYEAHAIAMFASKSDFVAAFAPTSEPPSKPRTLYEDLRREVARLANGGSYKFTPKHWENVGMHNGSDADALARWGDGLR